MSSANEHSLNQIWRAPQEKSDRARIQAEVEQAYAERDAQASRDRRTFDRLTSLPERTERQEQAMQNILRVAELEAHFDETDRAWDATQDTREQAQGWAR